MARTSLPGTATLVLPLMLTLAACGVSRGEAPGPGYQRGGAVALEGVRVMVLPVQLGRDAAGDLDREIGYALTARAPEVDWVTSDQLRSSVVRNPGIAVDGLTVQRFLAGDLQRIGDPLFGEIYRLGGLVAASHALVPVRVLRTPGEPGDVALELTVALIDVQTGVVPWFGIVVGRPGRAGDAYLSATAAEALASRLLP